MVQLKVIVGWGVTEEAGVLSQSRSASTPRITQVTLERSETQRIMHKC